MKDMISKVLDELALPFSMLMSLRLRLCVSLRICLFLYLCSGISQTVILSLKMCSCFYPLSVPRIFLIFLCLFLGGFFFLFRCFARLCLLSGCILVAVQAFIFLKMRMHIPTVYWRTLDCRQSRTLQRKICIDFCKAWVRLYGKNSVDFCALFCLRAVSSVF